MVRPRGETCATCPGRNGSSEHANWRPAQTWDHIAHSPNCSIAKAERLLAYRPRYCSLEAVYESVSWLIENKIVQA